MLGEAVKLFVCLNWIVKPLNVKIDSPFEERSGLGYLHPSSGSEPALGNASVFVPFPPSRPVSLPSWLQHS